MSTSILSSDTALSNLDYRKLSGEERNWRPGRVTPPDKYRERFIKRFWAKVDKTPGLGPWGNCWEWRGSKNKKDGLGYGNVGISANHALALGFKTSTNCRSAHTAAWIIIYGREIPDGHEMCHKCNNKPCVREDHLFTGTHTANIRHAQTTGVMPVAKPRPEPSDYIVCLSENQRRLIRQCREAQRVSLIDLAHMAQMDKSHLSKLERGSRPCRLTQLVFLLGFLRIDRNSFGLSECGLKPAWAPKKQRAKYLSQTPAYVYREGAPFDHHLKRRPPLWYNKLGNISTTSYNALALIETFKNAGIRQRDLTQNTGLPRHVLRNVLQGRARHDQDVLAVIRYAEAIKAA